jgi:hypothetical protein
VQEALVDVLAGLAIQEILRNTASRHCPGPGCEGADMLLQSGGPGLGKVQEMLAFLHRAPARRRPA